MSKKIPEGLRDAVLEEDLIVHPFTAWGVTLGAHILRR